MPKDRARKQQNRAAKDHTSRAYMDARRQLEDRSPKLTEVPAVEIAAPVAVEMARQLHAAHLHLSAFHRLAQDYGIAEPRRAMKEPTDPVSRIKNQASRALYELQLWAGRTAHASGAVSAEPKPMAHSTTPEGAAYAQLYRSRDDSGRWCATVGARCRNPATSTRARNNSGR